MMRGPGGFGGPRAGRGGFGRPGMGHGFGGPRMGHRPPPPRFHGYGRYGSSGCGCMGCLLPVLGVPAVIWLLLCFL